MNNTCVWGKTLLFSVCNIFWKLLIRIRYVLIEYIMLWIYQSLCIQYIKPSHKINIERTLVKERQMMCCNGCRISITQYIHKTRPHRTKIFCKVYYWKFAIILRIISFLFCLSNATNFCTRDNNPLCLT